MSTWADFLCEHSPFFAEHRAPRTPIVVAPMAGGPSTPELVVAAAEAGAFGFLAAGYLSTWTMGMQIEQVAASGVPFGLNLFVPSPAPDNPEQILQYRQELEPDARQLDAELPEAQLGEADDGYQAKLEYLRGAQVLPQLISFTFGCPEPHVIVDLQNLGCAVAITVTSAAEAELAEAAGADLLVVQHPDAGGHSAAFLDTEAPPFPGSLPDLLAGIGERSSLPVLATGAISTAAQVQEALDAGAIAAQVGTVFLTAEEAGTKAPHRAALTKGEFPGTSRTRAFSGKWARGLQNRFIDNHLDAPSGYPAIHYLTAGLRAAAAEQGDQQAMSLWAGTGFRSCQELSAAGIVHNLASAATEGEEASR